MRFPILYEINTRAWLRELSDRAGRPIDIADIPDSEIEHWVELGFTHIWLMGVWQIGPAARAEALRHWRDRWAREIRSSEEDVQGSPFAIQEYAIDSRLGEPLSLLILKERLTRAGLRLILDFVPNHFGLDSPEPKRYPARFVQSETLRPGTFQSETKVGKRYFAHGKDPYFAPWSDTVQLDYRVLETHQAMSATAQTISMFGDGLRCDMAMLLLPDVFLQTWKEFPSLAAHPTNAPFWKAAIPKIRELQPHVDLIAEAYWDREQELQDAGFDFTYNKRVYDYIVRGQNDELGRFLEDCAPGFLARGVHFIENHDEPRAASLLPFDRHKVAAALTVFLPGMALLHDGQLEGRTMFAPIQMCRRAAEEPNAAIQTFYMDLLSKLRQTHVRRGKPELLRCEPAGSMKKPIAVSWESRSGEVDLALVNLHKEEAVFSFPMAEGEACQEIWSSSPSGSSITLGRDSALIKFALPRESAFLFRIQRSPK